MGWRETGKQIDEPFGQVGTEVLRYDTPSNISAGIGYVSIKNFVPATPGIPNPKSRITIDVEYMRNAQNRHTGKGFLLIESHLPHPVENTRGEVTTYSRARITCVPLGEFVGSRKSVLSHFISVAREELTTYEHGH